jgi:hypothetical protein
VSELAAMPDAQREQALKLPSELALQVSAWL